MQMYNKNYHKIKCPIDKKTLKYKKLRDIGKNFTLVSLLDTKDLASKDIYDDFCPNHPNEKPLFYCLQDKLKICQFCILNEHLNHKFEAC